MRNVKERLKSVISFIDYPIYGSTLQANGNGNERQIQINVSEDIVSPVRKSHSSYEVSSDLSLASLGEHMSSTIRDYNQHCPEKYWKI